MVSKCDKSERTIASRNDAILNGPVKIPVVVETLIGRRRMDLEKLTDCLNASDEGIGADGLKPALALLWERRNECPGAVSVLVCHDEVVVECDADKAEEGKEWLVQAMKDGMDAVVNVVEPHILIEVEASVSKTWGGKRSATCAHPNRARSDSSAKAMTVLVNTLPGTRPVSATSRAVTDLA